MKLQNEEVMLAQLKTLKTMIINELNRSRSQCIKMRNFSEKSYLYNIGKVKIFCVLHNKLKLLTRRCSEQGEIVTK